MTKRVTYHLRCANGFDNPKFMLDDLIAETLRAVAGEADTHNGCGPHRVIRTTVDAEGHVNEEDVTDV